MHLNVYSWTSETSLTPHPLTKSFGYDSLLLDANFVQFDNFVPVLKTIKLNDDKLEITIQFDLLLKTITPLITDIDSSGDYVKIYDGSRYLGTLVFGLGVTRFLASVGDQTTLTINTPFLAHLVKSIPSTCGVYSINEEFGPLSFTSDANINYIVSGQDIEFNAIAYPAASADNYLKTLNSVAPTDNSVFIKSTEIIKVRGQSSTVEVSLVGNSLSDLFKANSIIVTSDDNV